MTQAVEMHHMLPWIGIAVSAPLGAVVVTRILYIKDAKRGSNRALDNYLFLFLCVYVYVC